MPVLVQEIVNRCNSALDAEGSDRYLFEQDFKPAIRYAQEWLTIAFNKAFSSKKVAGESLRELVKIGVWQSNDFSRIAFDPATMGHNLWSVLAVYPNPVVYPFNSPVPNANKALSVFRPDLSYRSGRAATNRLTLEEWNDSTKNVFMPGNTALTGDLVEYAYLDFADYSSSSYNNPGKFEIEVRPNAANKYVAVAYLKRPREVNVVADSLEFPDTLTNLIVEKALEWISWKQGDNTTLYSVSERDINQLVALMQS